MTTRTLLTAATGIALALAASAPAMASCRSIMATEFYGNDSSIDTRARDCAYWGVYGRGDRHGVFGTVTGPGSRVVTGSFGSRTRTHLDSRGFGNQLGTQARSGGRIDAFVRGHHNEMALRATNGSYVGGRVVGSGNRVRAEAW
ncbi:hypothetical protein [Methylorubrum sp. GM97]|uniref:hypothetical protein n=1 Tax=Methylorubrum sp. GM97 TaxID=2938232 RepID=UPI0021890583|nr:hypothetical protein [Methylorubrum sp. GM97]BDL38621.1 hypothetical protein MSPGM_12110 [Methylorubrum sp. GM97]